MVEKFVCAFYVLFVLTGLCSASTLSTEVVDPPRSNVLLGEISKLKNGNEIKVTMAAVFLQELLVNNKSIFKQGLARLNLSAPDMVDSKTEDGRDYSLIVFRLNGDHEIGGFVIFQHCRSGLVLRERGFVAEIDDALIRPFVSSAKKASTDYYKVDACTQFPGNDW